MAGGVPRIGSVAQRTAAIAVFVVLAVAAGVQATGSGSAGATPTPGCVVDTTGILGWWRGEDDLVAEVGPDLTGASSFADGIVARGFDLSGTDDLLVDGFPAVSTGLTVEMWIRPDPAQSTQVLASRWNPIGAADDERTFQLSLRNDGRLTFETDETTTRRPVQVVEDVPQLFDGGWHHVAATWDPTRLAIYVDGFAVGILTSMTGVLNEAPNTPLRVGSSHGAGGPFFTTGLIDEPTIWERALDASEVLAIYGAGSMGKCLFVPEQVVKFTAAAPGPNEWFGYAVGADGPTAVVGAPYDNGTSFASGTLHVYERAGPVWVLEAVIVAADGAVVDQLGFSVDVDEDSIVAGAYGANTVVADTGAAYVFTRSGATWSEEAKLVTSDAGLQDGAGNAVAIDGDTVVVGVPFDDDGGLDAGAAYVFTRSGTTWSEQAKLTASDAGAADQFGLSVAIDGDTVIVGNSGDDDAGLESGAAYVFRRTGTTWSEEAKIVAPDAAAGDTFGQSVTVDGDTVVIGSPRDDDDGMDSGAVYVFTRSGTTWFIQSKIVADDADAGDRYGSWVSLDTDRLGIGAPIDIVAGTDSGSVYVVDRAATLWTQTTKLVPLDTQVGDRFGAALAVTGSTVFVGSHGDDDHGQNSGSGYIFSS